MLDLEEDVGDEGKERSLSHRAAGPLSGNPAIVGAALFSAVRHVRGAFMKPAGAIAGAFSALGPVASLGVKLGALRLARTALPPAHTAAQIISLMVPVLRASGVGPRLGAAWGPLSGTSRTLQGAIVASAAIDGLRLARGALSLQSSESVGPDRLGSSLGQGPHKMASLVPRFKHVVQRLKRRLASLGAVLPADRFDASDAELMRFLVACDLLSKPQGNQDAIDAVVTTAAKVSGRCASPTFACALHSCASKSWPVLCTPVLPNLRLYTSPIPLSFLSRRK